MANKSQKSQEVRVYIGCPYCDAVINYPESTDVNKARVGVHDFDPTQRFIDAECPSCKKEFAVEIEHDDK